MKKKTSKRKIDKRFKIFLVICFVILIVLVVVNTLFLHGEDDEDIINNKNYLKGVYKTRVESLDDDSGILTSND